MMTPPYTYVYPLKALDEVESPQMRGQRTAVRPSGDTRDGDFRGFDPGLSGLGGLGNVGRGGYAYRVNQAFGGLGFAILPAIAGGYLLYEGCKGGYLPKEACDAVAITPGKQMPGICPDSYKIDGTCTCPVGAEPPSGGCSYPDAYTVDATGSLPIGGSPPDVTVAPAKTDPKLLLLGALALTVGAVLVFQKR
jgi:hypothetical protein